MLKYRRFPSHTLFCFLVVLLLTSTLFSITSSAHADSVTSPDNITQLPKHYTQIDVDRLLASLDDAQVRHLLKQALNDNITITPDSSGDNISGLGTLLNSMLSVFTDFSSHAADRFKKILSDMPKVFPDLYRVFITL